MLEGAVLPEPVRVVYVEEVGERVRVEGPGLRTGQYRQLLLDRDQLAQIRVIPAEGLFDGSPLRFRLGVEAQRLALAYEYDPFFSLSISKVDPLPHQVEAVYDFMLPLPRIRFLLADDAGAGKTIMAGLLLRELKLRGLVERTLIVAPANLAFQWQRELADRFRERFEIVRGVDLRNAYGTNPWQDRPQVITSIDWAKRDEVEESLARAHWELVIVDEAHRMSARDPEHKTERYRLGELLSERTDHFLLLTATPHKGDPDNFSLFLQLLDRDVYGHVRSLEEAMRRQSAPFYLRRTKEALVTFPDPETGVVRKLFTERDARTAAFRLDADELAFYEALTRYVQDQSIRAAADESARGRAVGFTMAMYQRRFASSLYAARRSLERRLQKIERNLAEREERRAPQQPSFDERRLEDLEELTDEEVARLEEEIEEASLVDDREQLERERLDLIPLIARAKELEERGVSSKLDKLRSVLTDENVFGDPETKLLVFSEHKDTVDFLVRTLAAWGLTVTQIHGGMKVGDRDTPGTRLHAERAFKEEAQVLVATEAAGEGINLQFCWLMVNYDIPWNPMRLEQRIGRIHRYGQERDVLVFNFVAENTREGQVLHKLLDRLDEIRRGLGSDQVFDVVGEVVPANFVERLLRDHYAGRISRDQMLERIVEEVDREKFERITASALEGLARRELNLARLVGKRAEAKERRLVPEVIEEFFLEGGPIAGINPRSERPFVARVGRLPRPLLEIGRALEPRFGRLGREYRRVAFDREVLEHEPTLEWVTPGHPLFEAVREEVSRRAQDDLRRGAVFFDLHREEPARLDVYDCQVKDGTGQTLHRRLFVVEATTHGFALRQPTVFLDLSPGEGELPSVAVGSREESERFLVEQALEDFLDEVRGEREEEVETISRHVEVSLNTLIDRLQLQVHELMEQAARGDEGAAGRLAQAEDRLDELNARLERRRDELTKQWQLALADLHHLGSAWVLPHPERMGAFAPMVRDPAIEAIAMREAMAYEQAHGWEPEDVSAENRGFDVLSRQRGGPAVRFIEVKGRAAVGPIALTANEYRTAKRLGEDFWLYAVFDCASNPRLVRVQDPARLGWEPVVTVEHYTAPPQVLEEARAGE
ncbi:MAG TPA: helicase-related protein [Gaiellaceae bacterium]|nr:helicase-related protein [Gaiellaceae bacterium]